LSDGHHLSLEIDHQGGASTFKNAMIEEQKND